MTLVTTHWAPHPFAGVVAVVVVLHEVGLARLRRRSTPEHTRRRRRRSLLFYGGLVVLVVSVASPVDYWSYRYFYAHMVSHVGLAFVAPMLIVGGAPWLPLVHGIPVGARRRLVRAVCLGRWSPPLRGAGRFLTAPWVALALVNATMVLWHVPALFDAAQRHGAVHVWLMETSLLVTGTLFFIQIVPSHPFRPKAPPLWQIGAIMVTNGVMFVLAMSMSLLTTTSWYPVYAHVNGVTMSPFADQQLGAAILWVCGDFWAVPALTIVVRRLLNEEGGFTLAAERLLVRARHDDPRDGDALDMIDRARPRA